MAYLTITMLPEKELPLQSETAGYRYSGFAYIKRDLDCGESE